MLTATDLSGRQINLPCSTVLGEDYESCVRDITILDLVNVFCATYIADVSTKQAENRRINLLIPVSEKNYETWGRCADLLVELLDFVTEADHDSWNIDFYPIQYNLPQEQLRLHVLNDQTYDNASLLSGGLDSFCGIYENQVHNKTSLYCGYKTNTMDASYISKVYPFANRINPQSRLCAFNKVDARKITHTQRTRSLLFFSLACFVAAWKNVETITVHENGIMSLNPSFESRGTTRTTHPRTIHLYHELLNNLNIRIRIEHPFLFSTKGVMVASLPEEYLNNIVNTRSCSRSLQDGRYVKKGVTSCGACVPCLLRKISLAAYNLEAYDHEYFIPYSNDSSDSEYCSAISYFKRFSKAIENQTIFASLGMREAYYSDTDYYENTYAMLEKFNQEMKIFFQNYGG